MNYYLNKLENLENFTPLDFATMKVDRVKDFKEELIYKYKYTEKRGTFYCTIRYVKMKGRK